MTFHPASASVGLLQTFAPLFSARVWPCAQALLLGAILAPGRRTVCAVLRVLGQSGMRGFQNYHRVLNRARWSSLGAARLLLQTLLRVFAPTGPLVLGLDDTIERRWGRKIAARGIYRDAARSSKSVLNKTSGLRWLSLQLLAPVPWAQRIWGLPFLTVLAPSARSYESRGRRPQTLTVRARQVLRQVRRWVRDRALIVVADQGYAALDLLAWSQRLRITLITPLRLDAALFAPAPAPRPGQRGRPRSKGAALPKLSARLKNPKTVWQRLRVHWYGQGRRWVEVATGTAVWYHSGQPPLLVRWVLVRDPQGKFQTRALLSTDPNLCAQAVVEYFTRRWQVEVTFEETRAHLGIETQRQWNGKAIARTTPALLGLFSIVTLMAHELEVRQPGRLRPRRAAWYLKGGVSYSDAMGAVRAEIWQKHFHLSGKSRDREKIWRQRVRHLTDLLSFAA